MKSPASLNAEVSHVEVVEDWAPPEGQSSDSDLGSGSEGTPPSLVDTDWSSPRPSLTIRRLLNSTSPGRDPRPSSSRPGGQKKVDPKQRWTEIRGGRKEARPPPRAHHSMVLSSDRLLVRGGEDISGRLLSDFWDFQFDSERWSQVHVSERDAKEKLRGRARHCTCIVGDSLISFGGSMEALPPVQPNLAVPPQSSRTVTSSLEVIDLAEMSLQTLSEETAKSKTKKMEKKQLPAGSLKLLWPPPVEDLAGGVVDINKWYLFGGSTAEGEARCDLWVYKVDIGTWSLIEPNGPSPCPRSAHSCAVGKFGNRKEALFVFGGVDDKQRKLCDLWVHESVGKTWVRLNVSPSPALIRNKSNKNPAEIKGRSAGGMVFHLTSLIVFGGNIGGEDDNALLQFHVSKGRWKSIHHTDREACCLAGNLKADLSVRVQCTLNKRNYAVFRKPRTKPGKAVATVELRKRVLVSRHSAGLSIHPGALSTDLGLVAFDPLLSLAVVGVSEAVSSYSGGADTFEGSSAPHTRQGDFTERVPGRVPCKRAGFAMGVRENKLYIFGGEGFGRKLNDLYCFRL